MKLVDIANEIYIDAGSPTDTSLPAIAFWIRGTIGTLNVLLYEDFVLNSSTQELTKSDGSDLSYEAIAVIKQLYKIYDYELSIKKTLNALSSDSILSIQDQGTSITRVNRNSVSQTYSQVRRDELANLKGLINAYRNKASVPTQVAGDDTQAGWGVDEIAVPAYLRG